MLNKLHQARWDAAKKLFQQIIDSAIQNNALILWGQSHLDPSQIDISDVGIYIRFPKSNCTYVMFEPDPDYDHGLYTPINEYKREIRSEFKLAKIVDF